MWCCDSSTFVTEHEKNHQTSNLNMKYSGEHNKRQCPDHRQTFAANSCVCVCLLPIFSGRQFRWKYQPGSHRIYHPPSFCGACLYFLARRIQPFLSLVDREVELRKIPFTGIELTFQRVRRLRGYQLSYREKKRKKKRKITMEKNKNKKNT